MGDRFTARGERHEDFLDPVLVVCPRCARCARVTRREPAGVGPFAPRRLTCRHCAYSDEWAASRIKRGWQEARDDFFARPLWLQTPCCGETLWAYNDSHLAFLEGYLSARLRERTRSEATGWTNRSIVSRLPRWISASTHRDEVMRGLARLRSRLSTADAGSP
jgi:hypothetical protein